MIGAKIGTPIKQYMEISLHDYQRTLVVVRSNGHVKCKVTYPLWQDSKSCLLGVILLF